MIIGISQLAFENNQDLIENLNILSESDIKTVEVVFAKFKNNIEMMDFKDKLNLHGIKTLSAQSILFDSNVKDLTEDSFYNHIKIIIEKSKIADVNTLVLGSPKTRNVLDLPRLIKIFKNIDSLLQDNNKILCIEPNCKQYGGKYFFNLDEICDFIYTNKFKNIKSMIDTHNLINENIDICKTFIDHIEYIHHVHISENQLSKFNLSLSHNNFYKTLMENKYKNIVTYEVLSKYFCNKSMKNFVNTYRGERING